VPKSLGGVPDKSHWCRSVAGGGRYTSLQLWVHVIVDGDEGVLILLVLSCWSFQSAVPGGYERTEVGPSRGFAR